MVKRALLIGINEYEDQNITDLRGCVNDVEAMASVLGECYGFDPANVTKLIQPGEHTREGIISGLTRLVDVTERGDVALVYYSGHGSQVPDVNGDEEDQWDETIVPSDTGHGPKGIVRDITDDELQSYVLALTERTLFTTFIFDSCHSGSVDRDLIRPATVEGAIEESRPAPRATLPAERPFFPPPQFYGGAERTTGREMSASGLIRQGDYLLIAGCRDEELSLEARFGARTQGMLTNFLVAQLRAGVESSIGAVFEKASNEVRAEAKRRNKIQRPVLEGPSMLKDAPAFSSDTVADRPAVDPKATQTSDGEPNSAEDPEGTEDPPPDPNGGGKGGGNGGEWDGKFAWRTALLAIGALTVLAIGLGLLTCSALDGESDSTAIVVTLSLELVFIGLLLAAAGAYVALLNLRGRSRAVQDAVQATGGAAGTRGVPAVGADEIKGIVDSIGKMPTARALIVVGGLIIGGAIAFAWDMLPGQLEGKAPTIEGQPAALTVPIRGKAQFDVSASGEDLQFEWKRNGKKIPWAKSSPTLFIEPVTKKDRNDVFTVVVKNQSGVTPSDGAKLTVVNKKGSKKGGKGGGGSR